MPTKVVVIGAGSASFGPAIVSDLLQSKQLAGSTIALCDKNAHGLELIRRLTERINREWDAGMTIEASTDRTEVLPGAQFVIVSIAVDRE
ncbi:MAG: family 4 glycosyl hydrolase, partial [Anaerolineae bacterium]